MSVKRWLETLRAPPDAVSSARESLLARAHDIAERTQLAPSVPTEIDVIVAGSGCLSLYYLGVHSVFDRLRTLGRLKVARYSGASSGAQAPYELVLTGVPSTFTTYLAAGWLTDQDQPNLLRAAWIADRHWKALSVHLVEEHAASLHRLDDTVFVSVSEFTRRGLRNALYSRWSSAPSLAQEAFYATGTLLTRCNGSWATDGGVTNNTPRFGDGLRPALQVSPTKAGLPMAMVVRYSLAQAIDAIELGQRDAAAWLSGQATPKPFELLADDAPRWHSSAPPATQVGS